MHTEYEVKIITMDVAIYLNSIFEITKKTQINTYI